ncbi:hypothetical protein ACHHYP_14031, partial [Achlya hypogyna]
MTLVLNEHMDPADIDDGGMLNVLPSGTPVKYLGILLGHALPAHHQANLLNDRFLASFQQWGCRARTIQGRRLLVNTMLLSQLWHVTAVVPVLPQLVARWQSMVNRFILSRKTLPTDRYRPLVHPTWMYDIPAGLGLSHIASKLRAQRLARLQLLMRGPSPLSPPLQELVLRQYQRTMGLLHRPTHPYDFLDYYPCTSSTWLTLRELHPLWVDVWSQWAATDPAKRVQVPPNLTMCLEQPMWLTTDVRMFSNDNHCTGRLAQFPETRRWCLHGAANGIRCLGDVVARTGRWPSQPDFIRMMSHANPAAQLAPIARANRIYHHLRRLHDNIVATHHGSPETAQALPPMPHRYLAVVKERPTPFQLWPKCLVRDLACHATVQDVEHPKATSTRTATDDIHSYVRRVRRILRRLPPVHSDVWLRLLYRMLPVNCRFAYLQVTNPSAVCCTYNCGAVETEHHALHAYPVVQPLWHLHACAWGAYGVSF